MGDRKKVQPRNSKHPLRVIVTEVEVEGRSKKSDRLASRRHSCFKIRCNLSLGLSYRCSVEGQINCVSVQVVHANTLREARCWCSPSSFSSIFGSLQVSASKIRTLSTSKRENPIALQACLQPRAVALKG